MPFIEEAKFNLMQEDLDNSKLRREEAEDTLTQAQEELTDFKQKSKIINIVLGGLLGLAIGAAGYFYSNNLSGGMSSEDIAELKKEESLRVIDSVQRAQVRLNRNTDTEDVIDSVDDLTEASTDEVTNGKTIYSVQIGVLSENKYPLLSSETIPTTVYKNNGYFKYSLGLYTTLEEAKGLRKELKKAGFQDAFVASYVNGERQKIHP